MLPQLESRRAAKALLLSYMLLATACGAFVVDAGWKTLGDQRPLWARELSYSLSVTAPADGTYTLLAPTLVYPDGTALDISRADPIIDGVVLGMGVVETERGPALMVRASGPVRIWIEASPPAVATEPGTYIVRFPGGNFDFGLTTTAAGSPNPEPQRGWGWRQGTAIGESWLNVAGSDPGASYSVSASIAYPGTCAHHRFSFAGAADGRWANVSLLASEHTCPVF